MMRTLGSRVGRPRRVFTISPAVNGQSQWDLDRDGPLTLSTAGTWAITPKATFRAGVDANGGGGGGGGGYSPDAGLSGNPGGNGGATSLGGIIGNRGNGGAGGTSGSGAASGADGTGEDGDRNTTGGGSPGGGFGSSSAGGAPYRGGSGGDGGRAEREKVTFIFNVEYPLIVGVGGTAGTARGGGATSGGAGTPGVLVMT